MSVHRPSGNVWRLGNSLLWLIFFLLGLQPDKTYFLLRALGNVVTQRAMVNSPYLITYALTAFLVFIVYHACREGGLSPAESRGKAAQLSLLALIAFFPFPFEQALDYRQIAMRVDRYLNVAFGAMKCWAWLYLLGVMIRYELLDGGAVFTRMASVFPSARMAAKSREVPPTVLPETKDHEKLESTQYSEAVLSEKDTA